MQILADDCILDTKTGMKYHLYDDYCEMSHNGKKVMAMNYLSKEEQDVIWKVKQAITDPATVEQKRANYPAMVQQQREMFSHHYENPEPVMPSHIDESMEGEEYAG